MASSYTEELEAKFERIKHDWGDAYCILCSVPATEVVKKSLPGITEQEVTIICPPNEFLTGERYLFYGEFKTHSEYGEQFQARSSIMVQPHTEDGIVRYLMRVPQVGAVVAAGLWAAYGPDAVKMLRENPGKCTDVHGLGDGVAKKASAYLKSVAALENCTIELAGLFDGRGFSKGLPVAVLNKMGNTAAMKIRADPYILLDFDGCGFIGVDKLYLALGLDPTALHRQGRCLEHLFVKDASGDTWKSQAWVVNNMSNQLSDVSVDVCAATQWCLNKRLLVFKRDEKDNLWLGLFKKGMQEKVVADSLWGLLVADALPWEVENRFAADLSLHQHAELNQATAANIGLFIGGPGTGKTYSVARLVEATKKLHGEKAIALAAPTNLAAKRLTESMLKHNVKMQATTIHALLSVDYVTSSGGWTFKHDKGNRLKQKFYVIDEASMIGTDLMGSFLAAVPTGSRVLFVGDVGQLPPVSHGAPLRDMIAAEFPIGRLTEIIRNTGSIVEACKAVSEGRSVRFDDHLDLAAGKNLILCYAKDGISIQTNVVRVLQEIKKRGLADPIRDCQVLVAVHKKSEASRVKLNNLIQSVLNPGEYNFNAGDKIVCTKKGMVNALVGKTKLPIVKGEFGYVAKVTDASFVAEFDFPKRLVRVVTRGNDDGSVGTGAHFDLGYAITGHRMQGSQAPVILLVLDDYYGAQMVCSREWVNTSISRAEKVCFCFGTVDTVNKFIRHTEIETRKTFLKEMLIESEVDNE